MAQKASGQVLQFSFIGLSNAVVDLASLNLLLWLWPTEETGLLLLFNTISYTLAIINSYFWNAKYTFGHHSKTDTREVSLFIVQAIIALGVSNAVFIGLMWMFHLPGMMYFPLFVESNISKAAAMFLSSTTSFFLMKFLVFRKKK
ncbi:GtrA family protein [Radiobacillus kanasensis]|uniref:GtrA family protein n=1 Tax=Radiobacillus kanasensis TaxID=2844358 RepID=UPI001E63F05B|nr:GtrA family protein [Radiobacillus kanasensis]UFT98268.1 GtrA family protein [Radiobacillus kanasensis]